MQGRERGARRRRLVGVLTAVLVLAALAASCGDDDDTSPDAGADTTGDTDATTADTGDDAAGEETDDEAADDSDGADEGAADAGLEELVAAAQEEGSLVWYSVPAEEIAQSISDGFSDEYGIDVEFQRLASRDLSQRYAAEVDAGDTVADALFVSNTPFVSEAMGNGWTTPLADAGIPGYPGDYPAEFVLDDRGTTIASIEPSGIAYNTDQVGEDEVPTDWAELAGPEWEGRILLTDPAASPAYVDFWSVVLDAQGPEVLEGIAANTIRTYPSGVPTTEALAAGEGAVAIPGVGSIVAGAAERGAPVAYSQPDLTTGPELVVLVSADAPHPNAARLFAWYLLFGEGEALANALPTTASPLTGEDLPPEYTRVSPDAQQRADEILGLLGAG